MCRHSGFTNPSADIWLPADTSLRVVKFSVKFELISGGVLCEVSFATCTNMELRQVAK